MNDLLPWLGLVTAVAAALLSFLFGRIQLGRANALQREEELRRRRVEVYASFCSAVVEYRRAQLTRWYAQAHLSSGETLDTARPQIVEDVRTRRAAAWSEYYKVLMIANDQDVALAARHALRLARRIREAATSSQVTQYSDDVHEAIDTFVRIASAGVLTKRPLELAPAAGRVDAEVEASD